MENCLRRGLLIMSPALSQMPKIFASKFFSKIESLAPLIWTQQGGEWLKIKKLFHGWKVLNSNWLGHGIPVRVRYLTEELEVRCKIELYSQLSRLLLPCSAIAECLRLKLFIFWRLCATSHELTFASQLYPPSHSKILSTDKSVSQVSLILVNWPIWVPWFFLGLGTQRDERVRETTCFWIFGQLNRWPRISPCWTIIWH